MINVNATMSQDVTRVPFDAEAAGWRPECEVVLFALSEPLMGRAGEVATHLVASKAPGTGKDTILVAATDENGHVISPMPIALADEGHTVAEVIEHLGMRDVTAA